MTMIHVLHHQTDEIIGWVSNVTFDSHKYSLSNEETYDFIAPASEKGMEVIGSRSRLLIPAEDGDYREFIVSTTHENTEKNIKEVYSQASFIDIRKSKILLPQTLEGQTVRTAASFIMSGLDEWELGITDYSPVRKWVIEKHLDAYSALKAIETLFGLELRFRVTTNGSKVTGRYVDFITRQGMNRGKEITVEKDAIGIIRKVDSDRIVTALICLGPEKDDGTRLSVTVTDDAAYQNWNRKGNHLVEVYEPESDDSDMTLERLTSLGEAELKKRISAAVEYEVKTVALEHIPGFEHEITRLGDSATIKDENFNPPMYLDSRVIAVDRSIFDNSKKTFKLGEVIEYKREDVMKAWRELNEKYKLMQTTLAKKPNIVRGINPPEKKTDIWMKVSTDNVTPDEAMTWNEEINDWEKATPLPDKIVSYGAGTSLAIVDGYSLTAFYDSFSETGRPLLSVDDTVPTMFDGNLINPKVQGYGKMYSQRIQVYIPGNTYDPSDSIETTVNIKDFDLSVAMTNVSIIICQSIAKEVYAYERKDGRVYSFGDLQSFVLRLSPHYQFTTAGFNADVDILVLGWR